MARISIAFGAWDNKTNQKIFPTTPAGLDRACDFNEDDIDNLIEILREIQVTAKLRENNHKENKSIEDIKGKL